MKSKKFALNKAISLYSLKITKMAAKKHMTVSQLIVHHKLNKPLIASLIGMPIGTFKNKLYENLPAWHFTKDEEKKIVEVLKTLAADIENLKLEAV